MSIFNSLGSNYNLDYVFRSFFSGGNSKNVELQKFLEEKYDGKVILTYKGREALTAALQILNLPKDALVAINGFTCVAVYNAIEHAGYTPLCLDLDKENSDLNFSFEYFEKAIKENKRIKAVVVQNTLGFPADIQRIAKICKENNIILIEDLAHCVGTKYESGIEAGKLGDFVVLSFSQDKVVDAVTGGALIIRNKKYQNYKNEFVFKNPKNQIKDFFYPLFTFKIRVLYGFGVGKLMHFIYKKLNLLSKPMQEDLYDFYSLPNWYCALALGEFEKLKSQLNHRRKIAEIYKGSLNKKILNKSIVEKITNSSNLRFPIFVIDRKSLIKYLKNKNIYVSDIWYDDVSPDCPNAVNVSKKILNLPTHINVSEQDANKICERINKWLILQ